MLAAPPLFASEPLVKTGQNRPACNPKIDNSSSGRLSFGYQA